MDNLTEVVKDTIKVWARNEWIYWTYSKTKFNIQRYIDDTFEATEIIKNLWLGALSSSCNRDELQRRGVETIISAALGSSAIYPFDFKYERAKLRDVLDEDILKDIHRLLPIIRREILEGKGLLCHCHAGKSRSVTIVAGYLIRYHKMGALEALSFIKDRRTQIDPNPGYVEQLIQFEESENNNEEYLDDTDKKND